MTTGPQPATPASPMGSVVDPATDFALRGLYRHEFDRIRRDFEATGSGLASLSDRTRLVDRLTLTLWDQYFSARGNSGYAMIAVGCAVVIFGVVQGLGTTVNTLFESVSSSLK